MKIPCAVPVLLVTITPLPLTVAEFPLPAWPSEALVMTVEEKLPLESVVP